MSVRCAGFGVVRTLKPALASDGRPCLEGVTWADRDIDELDDGGRCGTCRSTLTMPEIAMSIPSPAALS